MSLKVFALKIPDLVRSEMLRTNLINTAPLNYGDPRMQLLLDIWHDYIEPHNAKTACVFCMQNIVNNFKAMLPDLIILENNYLKLKSL